MFERSWTTTANIVGRQEPLGLIPLLAIPLWTGAVAVATALGYGTYQSVFGVNQATFDAGWKDSAVFDQRMMALKELWLKFDQAIQLRCPGFVKKDGGKWWRQFKADLNEFGAFYGKTGTHSWALTGAPTPDEIGGAISRLESLIGWGQTVERECADTFPGLGLGLTPSGAEEAARKLQEEGAGKSKDFFDNFGSNLGVTLGLGAIGLLGFVWIAGKVERGFQGYEPRAVRRRPRRKQRVLVLR